MDTWVWIVIAAVVIIVVGGLMYAAMQQRRRQQLREGFGPEYDRVVDDAPSKREAEAELLERRKRHEQLELRPLGEEDRRRYLREWDVVQARFVDDPAGAIGEADDLIQQVMRDRGYPVDDFEQRADDLSVEHPEVVSNYRAGHAIARSHARGDAGTEDLRQGLVHYRALFEDLVESGVGDRTEARR
jgi:hypothetical protein